MIYSLFKSCIIQCLFLYNFKIWGYIFLMCSFLKFVLEFIVDFQCNVSFRNTTKWISNTYTYIYSFLDSFPYRHYRVLSRVLCGSFFKFIYFDWRWITLQYCSGFCHTFTWISHESTCVPHPEPSSHLPPHPIPQGQPSAPALSTLSHASNLDWRSVSHMIIYMFQCHSPKPYHPHPLPQSSKTVLHICVSFAISHTGLSLPSF